MKSLGALLVFFLSNSLIAQDPFFLKADDFFRLNVDQTGMVDYQRIRSNPASLNELVAQISSFELTPVPEINKAFLINAYNLLVIKEVVDNYPLKSPLDNKNFFRGIYHNVSGRMVTLDQIEFEMLFKNFPDSRIHLVLVCAAKSCPPLKNRAYFPENIDIQIQDRAKYVMNLDGFIKVKAEEKELIVSPLFDWYQRDFVKDGRGLMDFINAYLKQPVFPNKVSYYEYNWTLNSL